MSQTGPTVPKRCGYLQRTPFHFCYIIDRTCIILWPAVMWVHKHMFSRRPKNYFDNNVLLLLLLMVNTSFERFRFGTPESRRYRSQLDSRSIRTAHRNYNYYTMSVVCLSGGVMIIFLSRSLTSRVYIMIILYTYIIPCWTISSIRQIICQRSVCNDATELLSVRRTIIVQYIFPIGTRSIVFIVFGITIISFIFNT